MKFPIVSSNRHKSKILEVDPDREIVTLIGINGEPLGSLAWDFVIDQILAYRKPHHSKMLDQNREFLYRYA